MTRGLTPGRGLVATFRTSYYSIGCMLLIMWILSFGPLFPRIVYLGIVGLSMVFGIVGMGWTGTLLARAHGTDTWRGVLGVFLPWLVLACCCMGAFAVTGGLIALAMRR